MSTTVITDATPNEPGKGYVQLTSLPPDYETQTTTARTVRLPSRGAPSGPHTIDVKAASAGAPLTVIGCESANPRFNVPLVGGPVIATAPGLLTFSCVPDSSPSGWKWVQV